MSFPAISSRGGLAANNSTRLTINNILFGSCMSQDEVLNLDNKVATTVEATMLELKENRQNKEEQAEGFSKESNCTREER